jgi:hypothetical protein
MPEGFPGNAGLKDEIHNGFQEKSSRVSRLLKAGSNSRSGGAEYGIGMVAQGQQS